MILRTLFVAALALGWAASLEATPKTVDSTHRIEANGAVRIDIPYGQVRIVGADEGRVMVRGSIDERLRGISIQDEAGAVEIRTQIGWIDRLKSLATRISVYPVDLVITVPRAVRLFVVSRDASITIDGVTGPIGIGVVSSSAIVRARPARLVFQAVSGSLDFSGETPYLEASTLSGRLLAAGRNTDLILGTGTGSLEVRGTQLRKADLSTVSGDVAVCGSFQSEGMLDVRTESGDVTLAFHGPGAITLKADTRDGEILNSISDVAPVREQSGHRSLNMTLPGEGSEANARVQTGSGLIQLISLGENEESNECE